MNDALSEAEKKILDIIPFFREQNLGARALDDISARSSNGGIVAGIQKRFRAQMVKIISDELIDEASGATRDRVKNWQKKVFGRSLSASQLKHYANAESGGGRGYFEGFDEEIEKKAAELFSKYFDAVQIHAQNRSIGDLKRRPSNIAPALNQLDMFGE